MSLKCVQSDSDYFIIELINDEGHHIASVVAQTEPGQICLKTQHIADQLAASPRFLASLQRLLGVTELNMDDMESETREAIQEAVDLVTPFEVASGTAGVKIHNQDPTDETILDVQLIRGLASITGTDIKPMLIVALSCAGNPDMRQADDLGIQSEKVIVRSLEEASEECRRYIEFNELGGGNWTGGDVTDEQGNLVARISYNGRIWTEGTEYFEAAKGSSE